MIVTPETKLKISVSMAAAIIGTLVRCTWKLAGRISALEGSIAGAYTLNAASEAALRTAIENPGFRVPDPREPVRIIEVRSVVRQP